MAGCLSRKVMALGIIILFSCVAAGKADPEPRGHEIYMAQCARCHGQDGKGNPAAAGGLPDGHADLTRLSKRNGGIFPAKRVQNVLGGLVDIPAHHGSNPMPIWGDLFDARRNAARRKASERLESVTAYLETIQQQ